MIQTLTTLLAIISEHRCWLLMKLMEGGAYPEDDWKHLTKCYTSVSGVASLSPRWKDKQETTVP